jgi:hypothetical protein
MDKNHDKRQQFISNMLEPGNECAASGDNGHILLWRRLAARLSPLIGDTGLAALHARAMRLVQADYPWLPAEQSMQSMDSLLDHLTNRLSSVDAVLAAEANAALLDTFSKLLSSLIGNALTVRLLDSAWSEESQQGNAKEQK